MERIAVLREKIYELFHGSNSCAKYFFDDTHKDELASYYTAMCLLQDSTESLCEHRKRGFNTDELLAYIEIWGVLQAIIIQQDAIEAIYKVLHWNEIEVPQGTKWLELRNIRNLYSGYPVTKDARAQLDKKREKDVERSFLGRDFGGYDELIIEVWNKKKTVFKNIELGKLIDDYTGEATQCLQEIIDGFPTKWP